MLIVRFEIGVCCFDSLLYAMSIVYKRSLRPLLAISNIKFRLGLQWLSPWFNLKIEFKFNLTILIYLLD